MQKLTIMDIDPETIEFTLSEALSTLEEQIAQDPDTGAYYASFSASAYNSLRGEEGSRAEMFFSAAHFITEENFDAVYTVISLATLGYHQVKEEDE